MLHSGLPSRSVTEVSLTITAALPLSQISVNRVTDTGGAVGRQRRRHGHGLAGVQHLVQLDVDAGELHRRWRGVVEALCDVAEGRQDLWRVVDQVAQLSLIDRVGAGTQSEVIELDIATGPREFDGVELGANRFDEIDWHVSSSPQCVTRPRTRKPSQARWCRRGRDRCDPSPAH